MPAIRAAPPGPAGRLPPIDVIPSLSRRVAGARHRTQDLRFRDRRYPAAGAEGEICGRTPSLLKGYWNKAEATAETTGNGWLHSGDIGVIDEDG